MVNKNSRILRKKFFQKRIPEYRSNPVLFAREVLLFEPDKWQKTALMDLAENPKVAIKSGQGVGHGKRRFYKLFINLEISVFTIKTIRKDAMVKLFCV